jgi:hypothetical protein
MPTRRDLASYIYLLPGSVGNLSLITSFIRPNICAREGGMRITFDTNTLDKVSRPERSPKDPLQPEYLKISAALRAGTFRGHFSETIITLEGVQRDDRATVFESTRLRKTSHTEIESENAATVTLHYIAEQPRRQPLAPGFAERISAAVGIGMRVLRAPRPGMLHIKDPEGKYFVVETDVERDRRLAKFQAVLTKIEQRGVGIAIAKALAGKFASRDNAQEPWFRSLVRAKDVHEENAAKRAIAEWADGDSIAAHIAYGIEALCTRDEGKTAGTSSILDPTNRAWLIATHGVTFVTLPELAAKATP